MQYFGGSKLTFTILVSCKYELPIILLLSRNFFWKEKNQIKFLSIETQTLSFFQGSVLFSLVTNGVL